MNKKLSLGIGLVGAVILKIIGTLIFQVQPEIVNTTITGIALGAGVVLILWGRESRVKNQSRNDETSINS